MCWKQQGIQRTVCKEVPIRVNGDGPNGFYFGTAAREISAEFLVI